MTNDQYQEAIKPIKQQYAYLDLTDDQAAYMLHHQNTPHPVYTEYYMNTWEQCDYEYHIFQKILNTAQFDRYLEKREMRIASHIALLKQQDENVKRNIEYKKQLLLYYNHTYIPELLRTRLQYPTPFYPYGLKIRYIQEEYGNFCKVWKLRVTSQHFRDCRHYAPQLFELQMLDVQLLHIMPNHQQFKTAADMPTQTVLNFLLDHAQPYLTNFISFFNEKDAEETRIKEAIIGSNEISGWHVEPLPESDEDRDKRRLFLLMMVENVSDNGWGASSY